MTSSHGNTYSEAAKTEQIVTEFFAKSLHIILESRSPYVSSHNFSGEQVLSSPSSSSSSSSSIRPRDKWFNLALRECPTVLENLDIWRQSNLEHLVIDVILVKRPLDCDPFHYSPKREIVRALSSREQYCNPDQEELGSEAKSEKIIERWVLQYESKKSRDSSSGGRRSSNSLHTLYKKSILLLRSLYLTVRLLPAYKIFRNLNLSGQIRPYSLAHRVSAFVEPFTRKQEADMQQFGFSPVDTPCGRLCLSVVYRLSLSDMSSEPSTPMSPQFIPDYVGSPLAEPLKRLTSLPISQSSPSSVPFSRRHSWSYDRYKASPPFFHYSPSPTYSEPPAQTSGRNSRHFAPANLPPHPSDTSSLHKKNTSFDEYYPSPDFTPSASPSPSPPIGIPGSNLSKAILRSESAPVNIPSGRLANSPVFSNKQQLAPSPPSVGIKCSDVKSEKNSGGRIEKIFSFGKDDTNKLSGVKISSGSSVPISFSRSSSRSFQDDFDETEFPCPFDVEDVDVMNPDHRLDSYDQFDSGGLFPLKKSQDAAVGTLVSMLKKARPLHQGFSASVDLSQGLKPKMWNNSLPDQNPISATSAVQHTGTLSIASASTVALKTTADALEELQGYKELMKDLLPSQSATSGAPAKSTSLPNPASGSTKGLLM